MQRGRNSDRGMPGFYANLANPNILLIGSAWTSCNKIERHSGMFLSRNPLINFLSI